MGFRRHLGQDGILFIRLWGVVRGVFCLLAAFLALQSAEGLFAAEHGLLLKAVIESEASAEPAEEEESALSEESAEDKISAELSSGDVAVVMVGGRIIATNRVSLAGFSPQERTSLAEVRLKQILALKDPGEVTTQPAPEGTMISIGDEFAFLIAPGDLNSYADETMEQAVARSIEQLNLILEERRQMRSGRYVLWAVSLVVLATAVYIGLLVLLQRGRSVLLKRLMALRIPHTDGLRIDKLTLKRQQFLVLDRVLRIVNWAGYLGLTYVWLIFCLRQLPATRSAGEHLGGYILDGLSGLARAAVAGIPNIFVIIVILLVAQLVTKLIRLFAQSIQQGRAEFARMNPYAVKATRQLFIALVWVFAFIIAYPYIPGSNSAAFKGIGLLIGLMISVGATGIFGQGAAGLSLMYSHKLNKDDYVRIGETEGVVESVGFLYTTIRTTLNEGLNIPNLTFLGSDFKNYTQAGSRPVLLSATVTIGYSAPWRKVQKMLLDAAEHTAGLLTENPTPYVLQRALSDFYVEYELRVAIENIPDRLYVLSDLYASIQDLFNENGVQIMSPHYEMDPLSKVYVPKDEWEAPSDDSKQREGDNPERIL